MTGTFRIRRTGASLDEDAAAKAPTVAVDPESADRHAQEVLKLLYMTDAPADPIVVARALGACVWTSDMDRTVGGILELRKRKQPVIYIPSMGQLPQQRFAVAHELGHLFEMALTGKLESSASVVDYDADITFGYLRDGERFADAFASSLLMPADHVRKARERGGGADALAAEFKVPLQAARVRLGKLGLREESHAP